MEYIAQKKLLAKDANGNLIHYYPGDVIKDFGTWNIHAKRAHLNLEWVSEKKDLPLPASMRPAGSIQEPKQAAPTELACDLCSKTYKDKRSLKIHKTVMHKEG